LFKFKTSYIYQAIYILTQNYSSSLVRK